MNCPGCRRDFPFLIGGRCRDCGPLPIEGVSPEEYARRQIRRKKTMAERWTDKNAKRAWIRRRKKKLEKRKAKNEPN